jgi:hypothetical protein
MRTHRQPVGNESVQSGRDAPVARLSHPNREAFRSRADHCRSRGRRGENNDEVFNSKRGTEAAGTQDKRICRMSP